LTDGEIETIKGQQLSVNAAAGMQLTAGEMQTIRGKALPILS